MNIYVVAEGVETVEQLNWLRGNGIAFAQGHLLGNPERIRFFQEWKPADRTIFCLCDRRRTGPPIAPVSDWQIQLRRNDVATRNNLAGPDNCPLREDRHARA